LTVVFGGSTGIEVSTVVSSTTGSISKGHRPDNMLTICGWEYGRNYRIIQTNCRSLVSLQSKSNSKKVFVLTNLIAVSIKLWTHLFVGRKPLFAVHNMTWHLRACSLFYTYWELLQE
jgi:CIC family chloride channel protein